MGSDDKKFRNEINDKVKIKFKKIKILMQIASENSFRKKTTESLIKVQHIPLICNFHAIRIYSNMLKIIKWHLYFQNIFSIFFKIITFTIFKHIYGQKEENYSLSIFCEKWKLIRNHDQYQETDQESGSVSGKGLMINEDK